MGKLRKQAKQTGGLAGALFPGVRQRVLGILYGQPERSFYGAELIRLAQSGSGAVQRELANLVQGGVISISHVGNQKHYQANRASPVFGELHGLVLKTVGLADPIAQALSPLKHNIRAAFVFGSVAKRRDTSASDIDLMVIAEGLGYEQLYAVLQPAERQLGRSVNPVLMTPAEWRRKLKSGRAFVAKMNAETKIFVVGSQNVLSQSR
jgi:predicted nucleotidyltransferase